MPLSHQVARFNRRVTNRVTRPLASRLPGFAILYHVGRRSGRQYSIPINVFVSGDEYIFALTYGPDTDWVKNVLAMGGCEIVTRGRRVSLVNPHVITDTTMSWAPPIVRLVLGRIGARQYLRMTQVTG